MTIRIILRRDDANMAAHVGGAVLTTFVTVDIECPEIEAHLRSGGSDGGSFSHTQIIGAEVLQAEPTEALSHPLADQGADHD